MSSKKYVTEIASTDDINAMDQKLGAFNQAELSFSGKSEVPIAFVIKRDGDVVAGISGCVDWGHILHVELLFVDDKFRHQGMGRFLLSKIEREARLLNAGIAQTDTFDFQAKDFYIKHGYEIFGVVEDSPRPGHRRYYLKKSL